MVNMGTALPDGTGSHSPMVTADRHRAARSPSVYGKGKHKN